MKRWLWMILVCCLLGVEVVDAQTLNFPALETSNIFLKQNQFPQINNTFYAGSTVYPTVQQATSAACATGSPENVVVLVGTNSSVSIPAVVGCTNVGIIDNRTITPQYCSYSGSYICTSGGGGGATLPTGALVYGISSTTSRAALSGDVSGLWIGTGCGVSTNVPQLNGNCSPVGGSGGVVGPSFAVQFADSAGTAAQTIPGFTVTPSSNTVNVPNIFASTSIGMFAQNTGQPAFFGVNNTSNPVYNITNTVATSGVATFTWVAIPGSVSPAPVVGDSVTITNTRNGSGAFNGTWTVSAVSGTTSGTFVATIGSSSFTSQAEANGLASNYSQGGLAANGPAFQSYAQMWGYGEDRGNASGVPNDEAGWRSHTSMIINGIKWSSGIGQGLTIFYYSRAIGDYAKIYAYGGSPGGCVAPSDECLAGMNLNGTQFGGYCGGSVTSTTGTGDIAPVVNCNHGSEPSLIQGGFLMNLSHTISSGNLAGTQSTTWESNALGLGSMAVTGSVTASTGICVLNALLDGNLSSVLGPPVSRTVACTVHDSKTLPTTGLPYVAWIASNYGPEQVQVTAVSAPVSGVQTITVKNAEPHVAGDYVFFGGTQGLLSFDADNAPSNGFYLTDYIVFGADVSGGSSTCTDKTHNCLILGFRQVIGIRGNGLPIPGVQPETVTSGYHVYPGALIMSLYHDGVTEVLEANNVPFRTANITAYSVSSNVVTLTATNSFIAGQTVLFSGLSNATFLNGQALTVSSTGLSGTQFEVPFTTGNVVTTADSGNAGDLIASPPPTAYAERMIALESTQASPDNPSYTSKGIDITFNATGGGASYAHPVINWRNAHPWSEYINSGISGGYKALPPFANLIGPLGNVLQIEQVGDLDTLTPYIPCGGVYIICFENFGMHTTQITGLFNDSQFTGGTIVEDRNLAQFKFGLSIVAPAFSGNYFLPVAGTAGDFVNLSVGGNQLEDSGIGVSSLAQLAVTQTFTGTNTFQNTLKIQSTSTSSYAAINLYDHTGSQQGSVGYGESGTPGVFTQTNFWYSVGNNFCMTTNATTCVLSVNAGTQVVSLNGGIACSSTNGACPGSGSGVLSINSTTGAFTFTGSGVSCTSTTCTFSGSGGTLWSAIGNPTTNLSLTMAANTSTFQYNATTGSGVALMKWIDTASNTGTGAIGSFNTASGSAAHPWEALANGIGWEVTSTGGFQSTDTVNNPQDTWTQGSGGDSTCVLNTTSNSFTDCIKAGVRQVSVGPSGGFVPYSLTVATAASALNTAAIASGACNTTTIAVTGITAADSIMWNPSGSIKAVTGYVPSTSGGLSITPYLTSGNVNFDVCNWSAGSITPGAVTIDWRVIR
jgi:hypothetical protein